MSQDLNLEANNLCIPEDAFEKFQAVSMYQEEEILILPQTVPPNPKPPEPSENNSVFHVNEVVFAPDIITNSPSSTQIVEKFEEIPLNSSQVESSVTVDDGSISTISTDITKPYSENTNIVANNYENESDMVVTNSENVNNLGESNLESLTFNSYITPRKRGRKPKKSLISVEEMSVETPKNIQNPDISSTPLSSDPEASKNVTVKKKRGRPPKVQPGQLNIVKPLDNDKDKELSSELSSSDNNRSEDTNHKPRKGKRGRPKGSKKILMDLDLQVQEQPLAFENIHQDENIKDDENVIQDENVLLSLQETIITQCEEVQNKQLSSSNEISNKCKRKRKPSVNTELNLKNLEVSDLKLQPDSNNSMFSDSISDNDDPDDICLSKLKNIPSPSNASKSAQESTDTKTDYDLKIISSESIADQNNKAKKKRGRPKKSSIVLPPTLIENIDPVIDSISVKEVTSIKDDADDISLSKLKATAEEPLQNSVQEIKLSNELAEKEILQSEVQHNIADINGSPNKRNTKVPVMADFEYNIDSVIGNDNTDVNNQYGDNSLLVEDTSKRPVRRKTKKLQYDEESDEDPFANVELSDDDEPRRGRRGNKYYSDDEYIPGRKGYAALDSTDTEISGNDSNIDLDESMKQRRKKLRKKSDTQSPRKRGKKDDDTKQIKVEQNQDDVEVSVDPAAVKVSDGESQPSQAWGTTTEFENFLAKKIQGTSLQIKKVSSGVPAEKYKIEIPVIDQDAKKTIEMCTQTISTPTTSTAVQTSTPYDIPMKENISLTSKQSEKACIFLNGIVKTTAELGLLMTQKSEDFIKKKINISHVTDTTKMDYCVKKSFLLFKLAKHNLQQMEEDLAKQYEEFLKENNLTKCREEQKQVVPTPKDTNSDSDCEIVEVKPSPQVPTKSTQKSQAKPAFNPKTVFLNKELSIKIAKKPNENKKLDIKGRHTVWINDTVMVKKVKPTQSFLAQDSRNKKPPDNCITTEMVSDFFKNYYRQKALSACASFISTDWLNVNGVSVCNYFAVKQVQYNAESNYTGADEFNINNNTSSTTVTEARPSDGKTISNKTVVSTPERLFTLCCNLLKTELCESFKGVTNKKRNELADGQNAPVTLFRLCLRSINNHFEKMDVCTTTAISEESKTNTQTMTLPLKTLCHRRIVSLLANSMETNTIGEEETNVDIISYSIKSHDSWVTNSKIVPLTPNNKVLVSNNKNGLKSLSSLCIEYFQRKQGNTKNNNKKEIKSLFSLCVECIQRTQVILDKNKNIISTPKSLKTITYEYIAHLLYTKDELGAHYSNEDDVRITINGPMINCVNTLSEEAFLSLEQYDADIPDSSEYLDDFDNEDNFISNTCDADDDQTEPSWVSQVQMQELRSCVNLHSLNVNEEQDMEPIITQIKLEPLDDVTDNLLDPIPVKTEPGHGPDEMTILPDIKPEIEEHIHAAPIQRQNSNSYDVDAFEQFAASNKLMQALTEEDAEAIYSQSSGRVRRQHEPDNYEEDNTDMLGLLVAHTYEPMNIQSAKGNLLESSSDESNNKNTSKKVVVKKSKRGRPKKTEQRASNRNVPDPVVTVATKEKEKANNEVAVLTRKMKERIRQEEKKNESTDSESENVTVRLRSREKKDSVDQTQDKTKPAPSNKGKSIEIQCSNVDSTDQHEEEVSSFTGFTSIETNEMSNYEKYMKFVYDKVIPGKQEEIAKDMADKQNNDSSTLTTVEKPVICPDEPVELLECEPTIFENIIQQKVKKPMPKKMKAKLENAVEPQYIERHGWQCYPVDSSDAKLYQTTSILLEKLPEFFVQTYSKYQNIAAKDETDKEINKLTNLKSLNRSTGMKDRKGQNTKVAKDGKSGQASDDDSRTVSANESDCYDELMPSDDDTPKVEDEVLQPVQKQTENTLAKSLLMADKDSDDEGGVKIKMEVTEEGSDTKKGKAKPKSKKGEVEETGDLMLTADKMMNKELSLLHAPVVMDTQVTDTPSKGPVTRHKKSASKTTSATKTKNEEDSSSEEEKQWVSTKEKLLKRMGKKETTSADDAKRAKMVSEFIERREGKPTAHKISGRRSRRSAKKFLEREKQLRVLQRELFGETSNDPTVSKRSVAAWKGRRNIRKVLDKKSLARSTVISNMEEFERKRRLNARQSKLRELLGCEEGVNVLVINDEVCLEYDFEEHRPVVTIHPFFTKVMKAHQYEGVKFMWDACFESLADVEAGHAGGGCILAHCMGLGKTLQVLALLHTVLTHPRVGMRRVLVCCPLSTVLNWVDEIHKWIGPVTNQIKVFELSKLKKTYERAYQLEDWYNGGGIFIIGYELFRSLSTLDPLLDDVRPTIVNKIRTALLDPGPDIVVCDEGHLLKNDCSVLAVAMSRVVTKRRIVLTGTPMQNNLREYYCMVNFVKPNLLGTYAEYSNRFENPIMNGQHRDSLEEDIKLMKARTHILHKVLEGCLQRQEVSVLYPYLPKKHEYTVFITLTKCQWDLYKHYLNHYSKQLKHNSILKDFHILQKIWSHPQVLHNFQIKARENKNKVKMEKLEDDLATEDQEYIKDSVTTELWWLQYLDDGDMLDSLDTSNKFVVVFKILDECVALGDKVLIFSTSLFCLDALEYFLKKINKWSLGQEYYRLDGSVPAEVRQKWCREFNADNNVNTKLFLVSTRAGCLGLNMTAANRVIIMDTSWNPAHDIQSIFRVYRFGQKKDCYIYRLVAMGTMEQKIYERSVTKQAVACRVVDEQQIDRHYNMAELTELYRYDEAGASVAGGVAVGVRDVALLRVAREAALHAVHEHDSLLRSSEQGLPEHERAAAWMQFQQEHKHRQMENKLIANIPKIALKRVHGQNYTTSFNVSDVKPEIKVENELNSEKILPTSETKTKRGRPISKFVVQVKSSKTSVNNQPPTPPVAEQNEPQPQFNPDTPSTSKNVKQYMSQSHYNEEMMVFKITQILMQHGFQNQKGNTEIADLVSKVREIVKRGYILKSDDSMGGLTSSIAKVLLQQTTSLPAVTNIMCESINNSCSPSTSQEPENILSTPTYLEEVKAHNLEIRRKRKAAIAAVKHIDSITQDIIIDLDNEFDPADDDFVPNYVEKTDKRKSSLKDKSEEDIVQINQKPESTVTMAKPVKEKRPVGRPRAGPKKFKEKVKHKRQELTKTNAPSAESSSSILLSDDDDVPANDDNSTASVPTEITPTPNDDDEVIPLPLSLLSNKNFINIVAHTYLNGNPMLDADAATLAAQYSTFKSLKEAEQTGKEITSGPIYDIAVKVIGKNLFKRMHSTNVKASSTIIDEANVTIELKEKMQAMTEKKPKKSTKSKKKPVENTDSVSTDITADCTNGSVVPVGLIQSAASMQEDEGYANNECILPDDDDDLHIVPYELPTLPRLTPAPAPAFPVSVSAPAPAFPVPVSAPAPAFSASVFAPAPVPAFSGPVFTPTTAPAFPAPVPVLVLPSTPTEPSHTGTITPTITHKPKHKILNHTMSTPPSQTFIQINSGKIVLPSGSLNENKTQANLPSVPPQRVLPSNDTICLDSDDEDSILPSPAPASASPAPSAPPTILNATLESPAQAASVKPLILRQVAAANAPKFVLLPSANNTGTKLAKLLPKEPVMKQTTQQHPTISIQTAPVASKVPTPNPPKRVIQTRCKPGDIIKISETGEIQVLQSTQLNMASNSTVSLPSTVNPKTSSDVTKPKHSLINIKPKPSSETSKQKSAEIVKSKPSGGSVKTKNSYGPAKPKPSSETAKRKSTGEVTKPKSQPFAVDTVKSKPSFGIKQVDNLSRRFSVSSSSSSSRPSSPQDDNPLSILKNVVRIQAVDETLGTSPVKNYSKTAKTHKNDDSNSLLKTSLAANYSKDIFSKATQESPKTSKETSKSITDNSKTKDQKQKDSKKLNAKTTVHNKTEENSKSVSDVTAKRPMTTSSKTGMNWSASPVKAVDIKPTLSSKAFSTVDLTYPTVISGSAATMLKTKIEVKKRVSTTTETSAPKKKKTGPMTLQDFDIDDIDDIIELD